MRSIDYGKYGAVGEFLKENIDDSAEIKITSSYFTIYAYDALKEVLDKSKRVQFLFNEPTFVRKLENSQKEVQEFEINREKSVSEFPWEISLKNNLDQGVVAKVSANFIKQKADVKSITSSDFLMDNRYYVSNVEDPFMLSAANLNFTQDGLGILKAQSYNLFL